MRNAALILTVLALASCGKKKADEAPPEGWYSEDGWPGQCYFPKNYDALAFGDRKLARSSALTEIVKQWSGERGDGIKFSKDGVEYFETIMLGEPELVEDISKKNAAFCRTYMSADEETRSIAEWKSWMKSEPARLTEGDCPHAPLVDTVFQYLDIDKGWQFKWGVCEGDEVTIKGTTIDMYKLDPKSGWIDVTGNGEKAVAEEYECNLEGCYVGQLIMRFTAENDVQTITPIGSEKGWTAPAHGWIEVQINDLTWFDNEYRQQGQLIDHASITYVGK